MEDTKLKIIDVSFIKASSPKIKARADVQFDGFILKGFKVIFDSENHKDYVTPPSYFSPGKGWRMLFRTDNPKDWQQIQSIVLKKYSEYELKDSIENDI